MAEVRELYAKNIHSSVPLLQDVNKYILNKRGKELRTILVLLSACVPSASTTAINEDTIRFATAMELLHNASLMHDDVVDNSPIRRGMESVKQHWNNKLAVLCGDYYFAQIMWLLEATENRKAIDSVCSTVIAMSEGEILQQQYIDEGNADFNIYYDIIARKTGKLMATSCELGNESMRPFGEHYGMAFQLWDDINDYDDEPAIPKPPLEELRQQKEMHSSAALSLIADYPDSPYKDAITRLVHLLK